MYVSLMNHDKKKAWDISTIFQLYVEDEKKPTTYTPTLALTYTRTITYFSGQRFDSKQDGKLKRDYLSNGDRKSKYFYCKYRKPHMGFRFAYNMFDIDVV